MDFINIGIRGPNYKISCPKGEGMLKRGDLLQKPTSKRGAYSRGGLIEGGGGLNRAFTLLHYPKNFTF